MSGCFNSEKQACLVPRVVVEQIERVDKRLSSWEEKIKYFDKVFSEFKEVIIKDIDGVQENFAQINKRLDTLEDSYRGLSAEYDYLDERLKKLERGEFPHECKSQESRIENKKPHKCPVCNGFGSTLIHSHACAEAPKKHFLENNACHCCKGKGIVWG